MSDITTEEVLHLGQLGRITITPEQAEQLKDEIGSILSYVGQVKDIAGDIGEKQVGARFNVMREDEVTNEPGAHTEAILNAAPERDGQFVKVKKILNN